MNLFNSFRRPDDPLASARGMIIGMGLGAALWGVLAFIVWAVRL